MTESRRFFSGAPWEEKVAYCRAIMRDGFIAVSGTASVKDGKVWAPNDAYGQTKRCLEIIQEALQKLGSDKSEIVRTRMFVTAISKWEEFGRAHREFFQGHPPATSMLEVKSLIDPEMLIEIEVDAVTAKSE